MKTAKSSLLKLSEKGCGRRSERGFDWRTEGEMDRKAPLWRPTRLRCKHLRGFSDSLKVKFTRNAHSPSPDDPSYTG